MHVLQPLIQIQRESNSDHLNEMNNPLQPTTELMTSVQYVMIFFKLMLTLMLQVSTAVQIRDKFVGHHTLILMEIAFQKLISQVLVNLNHVQKIHMYWYHN